MGRPAHTTETNAPRIPACPTLQPTDLRALPVANPVAILVDQWDRRHAIGDVTVIGRDPEVADVAIAHPSVSRAHAEICCDDSGRVLVRDLSSTNGTFVGGTRTSNTTPIRDEELIVVGDVALLLITRGTISSSEGATSLPLASDKHRLRATLSPVRWHVEGSQAGAFAVHGADRAPLASDQLRCLRALIAARAQPNPRQVPQMQGYVRSVDLLGGARGPQPPVSGVHVRAVIRRLRATLASIGLDDMLLEHERFGYRLRVLPTNETATEA